jgi:adenylylsulfate kinase
MKRQMGWAVWMTGLPGSGKTTLAHAVQARLCQLGVVAVVLDSDVLRALLTPAATYAPLERDQFYRTLVSVAALLCEQGCNVLLAATAHRRAYRKWGRAQLPRFAEVWVRCSLTTCRARDPKGLYARAAAGQVTTLPGVGADYEPPAAAEIVVDTDQLTIDAAAAQVIAGLAQQPW